MNEIKTERLILRPFRESDYDDLYYFLSQLKDDEFDGYPGITYEKGKSIWNIASVQRIFLPDNQIHNIYTF